MRWLLACALLLALTGRVIARPVLYLNPCLPSGCVVTPGTPDARTDTTDLVRHASAIPPWRYGPTAWSGVVSCVQSVLAPFDIAVTDVDPGGADHLEVMIAGGPAALGQPSDVGGLSDIRCSGVGACAPSEPNALVFVFADAWAGNVTATCASAAQQIGHTWALDHVLDANDPMSALRGVQGVPAFRDHQVCGGDCVAGYSQFGVPCQGVGATATHPCIGTGTDTQDEVQTILAVLGPSTVPTPTLALAAPAAGAAPPGFPIAVTCAAAGGAAIAVVDVALDGAPLASLTMAPFATTAPASLSPGAHTLSVTCATADTSVALVQAISVGAACATAADCAGPAEVCDAGACIAGPDAAGGLGATCKTSADCSSQTCASEGDAHLYCVIACTPGEATCPDGFGCFAADGQPGLCWLTGAGGCGAGEDGTGYEIVLMLGLLGRFRIDRRRDRPTP